MRNPGTSRTDVASGGEPVPRIIGNSAMWQSERWNLAVRKIPAEDNYVGAIRLAGQLVLQRRHYDAVYTVAIRHALVYGLFCRAFGTGNKAHIATEVLLDEMQTNGLSRKIKRALMRFALRKVSRVIVFSNGERELYSHAFRLPVERIVFVPFHSNIQQPRLTPLGAYGFSAGRSLRDYKTFFAAVETLDFPFVVVADRASVEHLRKPGNVELHCDVPRARYLELLEGARFVVVPLQADYRSSGQVVVLEAASLGKPVVASDVVGVRDYVSNGVDGLLVPPGNPESLRAAIQTLIGDDAICHKLGAAALERVENEHTFSEFADRCLEVIADACRA